MQILTRQLLLLAIAPLLVLPACSKKKGPASPDQCKSLMGTDYGRAVVQTIVAEGKGLSEEEADAMAEAELFKECQLVPSKVLDCYSRLDLESSSCDAAINAFLGLRDATPKQKGPAALWSFPLQKDWLDLVANEAGLIVVAYDDRVVAIEAGKEVWTRELESFSGRLAAAETCVLAPTEQALHCLSFADGKDLWQAPLTLSEDVDSAVAVHAGRALLIGDAGAISSFDLARCAKNEPCQNDTGVVAGPYSEFYAFAFAEDGHWMLGESERLRLFDAQNQEQWSRAGYRGEAPSASGNRFVVLSGKEILEIEASACAADASSCARTVATVRDEEAYGAVALPGGGIAVVESAGVIATYGPSPWKLDAKNDAELVVAGEQLFSLGSESSLDEVFGPMTLRALDVKTGETLWMSTLDGRAGFEPSYMRAAGNGLAVVLSKTNELLHIPRTL